MAPFIGPTKQEVLQLLNQHRQHAETLPITLGKYQPQFTIRFHQQQYELLPLVLDEVHAAENARHRMAEGNYVPEMVWTSLREGMPIIQESSVDVFIKKLDDWSGWIQLNKV